VELQELERAATPGLLASIVAGARKAWPEVEHSDELFLSHLASKIDAPIERSLGAIRTDDLFLASACALGEPTALAAFEERCLPAIDRPVARIDSRPEAIADVRQLVRQLVLVPRESAPPRIADFSGRSRLSSWLRAIAVREAVRLARRARRDVPLEEDELAEALGPDAGPELRYFKRLYQAEFRIALKQAIEALTDRQRTLLRQNVLDGVSIDRLAGLYGIHRATAARWVQGAREDLAAGLRTALRARLQVTPSELESILRLIDSQLQISLRKLL
jgi:RNA polymerase sigma-70 factor (ECF subfamily)